MTPTKGKNMTTKAAKATFEGFGLRVEIMLDSADQTARLTATEACKRVAYQLAHWSVTPGTATAHERAAYLSNSDDALRPAIKRDVATITVAK